MGSNYPQTTPRARVIGHSWCGVPANVLSVCLFVFGETNKKLKIKKTCDNIVYSPLYNYFVIIEKKISGKMNSNLDIGSSVAIFPKLLHVSIVLLHPLFQHCIELILGRHHHR